MTLFGHGLTSKPLSQPTNSSRNENSDVTVLLAGLRKGRLTLNVPSRKHRRAHDAENTFNGRRFHDQI